MAEILAFNLTSREKAESIDKKPVQACTHKQVTAYTVFRTVRCNLCGAELDPFDVLVDMLKAYIPDFADNVEENRLQRESEKRSEKKE